MEKTKLSNLMMGTITHWDSNKNNFIRITPNIKDIEFKNIIENKDVHEKLLELDKQKEKSTNKKYLYELIGTLTNVEMDLSIDEFEERYNTVGSLFTKFCRHLIKYCMEQVELMKEINEDDREIDKITKDSKKDIEDYIKTIEEFYRNEKDTKKKQQLFVELSRLKEQLNK